MKVSEISLGSWLTYGGSVTEEQARACIHRAYELGINFFDTTNVCLQGAAEEIVGRALKDFERDSYFLATKVLRRSRRPCGPPTTWCGRERCSTWASRSEPQSR